MNLQRAREIAERSIDSVIDRDDIDSTIIIAMAEHLKGYVDSKLSASADRRKAVLDEALAASLPEG